MTEKGSVHPCQMHVINTDKTVTSIVTALIVIDDDGP